MKKFVLAAGGRHLRRALLLVCVAEKKTRVPHFSRFSKSGPPDGPQPEWARILMPGVSRASRSVLCEAREKRRER
jgi:hypothetical protein